MNQTQMRKRKPNQVSTSTMTKPLSSLTHRSVHADVLSDAGMTMKRLNFPDDEVATILRNLGDLSNRQNTVLQQFEKLCEQYDKFVALADVWSANRKRNKVGARTPRTHALPK
jgi:hypothetical protein